MADIFYNKLVLAMQYHAVSVTGRMDLRCLERSLGRGYREGRSCTLKNLWADFKMKIGLVIFFVLFPEPFLSNLELMGVTLKIAD